MKKIIAMAIGALFITVATNAQIQRIQDSTFDKNRPVQHKKMVKERDNWNNLNLTDLQKKQMKENQESLKKQRDAVRNDASLTQEQKKSKMMEIQKASREKANKILTEDQKAAMKANQKEKRSTHKEEGQHHKKGNKGQGMKGQGMKQLDLSQEQQSKMKILRSEMQEQIVAINKNTKLTEEQKKQQIKNLRAKNMEQMMQVLTPEQKLKMEETRGNKNQNKEKGRQQMEGRKGMKGQGMNMQGEGMKQLDLSQDQQAKMKQLRTEMQEQTVAINKNTKLTEVQKKQQIKDLRAKNMEQMNEVLTPEQKLKMKETRGDKKQGNTRMKNRMEQSR